MSVPFALLVENLNVGVAFIGPDNTIQYCNAAEARLRGTSRDDLVGRSVLDCHGPASRVRVAQLVADFRDGTRHGFNRMRSGREQFVEEWFAPLFADRGVYQGMMLVSVDVTVRETSRRQYETLASRDELTGLFNKNHFLAVFADLTQRLGKDWPSLALLVMDINGLKEVNDHLGHEAGDCLIKQAAEALRTSLRSTDYAFRFGGDEFAALMPGADERAAEAVWHRVKGRCRAEGAPSPALPLRVGLGWAVARSAAEAERLFAQADQAMYEDKAREKSR